MSVLESPLVTTKVGTNVVLEKLDIEHAIVQDDPRDWSRHRKVCIAS